MEEDTSNLDFDFTSEKQKAIRYWERRRWVFLALLVPPTIIVYLGSTELPAGIGDRRMLSDFEILLAFLLAFLGANICYSFAYVVEFFYLGSPRYSRYLKGGRSSWFAFGCILGIILAVGTAREIGFAEYRTVYP
jgi:hypothetical protein